VREVQVALARHRSYLTEIYRSFARGDIMSADTSDSLDVKEFGDILKAAKLIDRELTLLKACHIFIMANYEEESGVWDEWDWEMELDEFLEAMLRIADIKSLPAAAAPAEATFSALQSMADEPHSPVRQVSQNLDRRKSVSVSTARASMQPRRSVSVAQSSVKGEELASKLESLMVYIRSRLKKHLVAT
jgi:hypothetical protein